MTTRTDFTADEWDLVVQAPRWVVAAASAAQRDLPYRTDHEIEAGFVETARAAHSGNAFVAEVAIETMKIFDVRSVVAGTEVARLAERLGGNADDRAAGLRAVLDKVGAVVRLLGEKADPADASAYRRWLVKIADVVIAAARTGVFGPLVTDAEQSFRERLVLTLQR